MFSKKQNSFSSTSEMAGIISTKDWGATPLGSMDTWPIGLRSTLGIMLNSRFPMFLFWGKQLTCFYNDACHQGLGINGRHSGILGKSGATVLSETWHVILPIIEELMATGETSWHEDQWLPILRDGKMENTYWTSSYSPVNDDSGKFEGILVTLNDVTEKVEARKKMEDAEERVRLAIEIAEIATWDLDLQTHKMIHSESLATIFGYQKAVQLSYSEIMAQLQPDDLINIVEKAFERAMRTGIYKYEARIVKQNGEIGWIRSHGQLFFDANNEPLKILGTMIDITDEKTFTELLEQQVDERTAELKNNNINLIKTNIELQSFVYVSSHDLQEPLRKIQTFISRLKDTEEMKFTVNAKDYFDRINKASKRMQSLILDLLAYSKTNLADKVFVLKDLQELAEEVKDDYSEIIMETNANVEINNLCAAKVIPFQFRQLLNNLIGNALKFTRPNVIPHIVINGNRINGSEIKHLGANEQLMYCHITISDNGIGFSMEYKERIFEVFQRLHSKSDYTGTGIGLAIVKKIVENHYGIITASGAENEGATFDVYIPEIKDMK